MRISTFQREPTIERNASMFSTSILVARFDQSRIPEPPQGCGDCLARDAGRIRDVRLARADRSLALVLIRFRQQDRATRCGTEKRDALSSLSAARPSTLSLQRPGAHMRPKSK
jgi:hypothetical protein